MSVDGVRHPFFFGYGSLVNRATHDYPNTSRARVKGWRRAWRHTRHREVSFLTAVPCGQSEIDGLIAAVPDADWQALDAREYAYQRYALEEIHHRSEATDISLYAIPEGEHTAPGPENPILLSYIDTVVAGYLSEYGPKGVEGFFETTDGWEAPIFDDRRAPRYPRALTVPQSTRDLADGLIRKARQMQQL